MVGTPWSGSARVASQRDASGKCRLGALHVARREQLQTFRLRYRRAYTLVSIQGGRHTGCLTANAISPKAAPSTMPRMPSGPAKQLAAAPSPPTLPRQKGVHARLRRAMGGGSPLPAWLHFRHRYIERAPDPWSRAKSGRPTRKQICCSHCEFCRSATRSDTGCWTRSCVSVGMMANALGRAAAESSRERLAGGKKSIG